MRRPTSILLLEAVLVIEWVVLTPALALLPIALLVSISAARSPLVGILLMLGVGGLAALNVFCWRQQAWALWIRAGLCFLAASALAPLVPPHPAVGVFVLERMLQTGLAVWLAARR